MKQKKEIKSLKEIKLLVDVFYGKVRQDDLIGVVFNRIIGEQWPEHLEKMYRFWQTVLLLDRTYYGNPFIPHVNLPLKKEHFERWLELFRATMDDNFIGDKAAMAKARAEKMAEIFQLKINHAQHMAAQHK